MASNKTPNLNLDIWAELDFFKRAELNGNFSKIDSKSKENSDKIVTLSAKTNGVINILEFGAKPNDMTFDNYDAIKSAVLYAKTNGIQFIDITGGYFRIGRGSSRLGGIELIDFSNITVRFSANAYILMDNLNTTTGNGDQAHGIYVAGNSNKVTLINPDVRWVSKAAARSQGDGIRFLGGNDPNTVPRNIKVINPYIEKTPQAGIIFYGCKDIEVEKVRLYDTWADGVHFNACFENIKVNGVYGKLVGDDTVALVTYYNQTPSLNPPFSSPDMVSRNNNKAIINGVVADGGIANGVRLSGAYDVQIDNVICNNKKSAVVVDSAIADGTNIKWTYLASKKISIGKIHSKSNSSALQVEMYNPSLTVPSGAVKSDFDEFDVTVNGIKEEGSTLYGITLESCKGVNIYTADCKTFSKFRNVSKIKGDKLKFQNGLELYGSSTATLSPIFTNMSEHDIDLGDVEIYKSRFLLQDTRKVRIKKLKITETDRESISFVRVVDVTLDVAEIVRPNRLNSSSVSDTRGINCSKGQNLRIKQLILTHDANTIRPIEIGGGDSSDISKDIYIDNAVYINSLNQSTEGLVVQSGSYAPTNWYVNINYYNGGETSPKWRVFSRKESPNGNSTERPTKPVIGQWFFDTTLNKPIWFNGASWVDSLGATV